MTRTIGLLGGGQLGQMLCEAANPLGIKVVILDKGVDGPAKQVNAKVPHIDGGFTDPASIRRLAETVDLITVEIEHVDTYVLEEIEKEGRVEIQPSWKTLRTIQDKYLQKSHFHQAGVRTAVSEGVENGQLDTVAQRLGFPFMLKARKDAYDGRGNFPVKSAADYQEALEALKGRALYAEKWANFKMELAVMVVKTQNDPTPNGEGTIAYPAVETIHEDSICKLVYCPPRGVSEEVRERAQALARKATGSFWGKGVFGVELFLMEDGELIVNEIAPRSHNSGHYTIEACPTMSQFKSHLLSILDLMPSFPNNTIPSMFPATIMLNIIGGKTTTSHDEIASRAIQIPTAALHMYGKESKPARKIGHVTLIGSSMPQAESLLLPLLHLTDVMRAERKNISPPKESIPSSPSGSVPQIAVTMGSDSDLPVLKPGLALLESLQIPYFLTITSAHRTPLRMQAFASSAVRRGFKVIIAAAGGAAHLPGMVAASTPLPVIGVPVKGSTLDGMDSLLSIVQMPRGIPVATVAINNSVNAALLAARILGASDEVVRRKLEDYAARNAEEVGEKAERLEEVGFEKYLSKE